MFPHNASSMFVHYALNSSQTNSILFAMACDRKLYKLIESKTYQSTNIRQNNRASGHFDIDAVKSLLLVMHATERVI